MVAVIPMQDNKRPASAQGLWRPNVFSQPAIANYRSDRDVVVGEYLFRWMTFGKEFMEVLLHISDLRKCALLILRSQ